jgi:hypothetical protein
MKLSCSHCRQNFQLPEGDRHPAVRCPHCGRSATPQQAEALESASGESEPPATTGGWLGTSLSALVSLVVHMALLLICALVVYDPAGGRQIEEEVQIGSLPEIELRRQPEEELQANEVAASADEQQLDEVLTPLVPADTADEEDTFGVEFLEVAPFGGGEQFGEIGGPPAGGGVGEGVTFMNVRATGRRFCIIADTSGSMSGPKLDYVKEEILETVGSMKPMARFQLLFYSSRAIPYPKADWLHPRKEYASLETWLEARYGSGGTQPITAFRLAFELDPPPDAIFFMTDGLFPVTVVEQVAELQRSKRRQVVIHTISFMDRSTEFMMQEIARNSGGTYRHVAGF